MCLACDCRKVCSQREPLNRILGIVRPCFTARASSRLFSSAPSLWQGQHAAFSSNIRGTSPSYNSSHWWWNSDGGKSVKHLISCRVIAVLHCGTPWVLAPRARLFHLILRQHLFHSSTMIVPKYFMQTAALLHLNSLLNPFLVPPVWPLLHFLQARPHKYYPCTTNSIMRAVKRGKPTALSVFITLGRPGCKWKEIRGLLFLLMGRGRAGLAS